MIRREVKAEKLVSGGYALTHYQGKTGLIHGAFPGETVLVSVTSEKKNLWFGETLEVLQRSPNRRNSLCPHSQECGGCPWIELQYESQLDAKKSIFQESFRRIGKLELPSVRVISSPQWNYRSRVQFHVDQSGKRGFKAKQSNEVAEIDYCRVMSERLNGIWKNKGEEPLEPGRYRVIDSLAPYPESQEKTVQIEVASKLFSVHSTGFFQSNRILLEKVISIFQEKMFGNTLIELYGGVGVLSAFLTDNFQSISMVEKDPKLVQMAKVNLGEKIKVFGGSAESWVKVQTTIHHDWLLVDPPRTGLSPQIRKWIGKVAPKKIAYLSCNPDTQARDIKELSTDYKIIDECFLLDFYPQTPHMESLVFLERVT